MKFAPDSYHRSTQYHKLDKIHSKSLSADEDLTLGSFQCYQRHLETLVVPELIYILTGEICKKRLTSIKGHRSVEN